MSVLYTNLMIQMRSSELLVYLHLQRKKNVKLQLSIDFIIISHPNILLFTYNTIIINNQIIHIPIIYKKKIT